MSDPTENLTNPAGHADVEMFDFYVAQLEAYLDGELDAEEAAQVRRRLMQEEAYAAALGRLHAQRVQRMEVFRQIEQREVDPAAPTRLAASAKRMRLQAQLAPAGGGGSWPTWTKVVFGMAACLLVGFGAGMIGTYNVGESPTVAADPTPLPEVASPESFTGWVLYEDGRRRLEVPQDAEPMQFDENRMTPLVLPQNPGRQPPR